MMTNIDYTEYLQEKAAEISSYFRNIGYSEFAREWQRDEVILNELQNAADCFYVDVYTENNSISIKYGTTYISDNITAQEIIVWITETRIRPMLDTYAREEITNIVKANPKPVKEFLSQGIAAMYKG